MLRLTLATCVLVVAVATGPNTTPTPASIPEPGTNCTVYRDCRSGDRVECCAPDYWEKLNEPSLFFGRGTANTTHVNKDTPRTKFKVGWVWGRDTDGSGRCRVRWDGQLDGKEDYRVGEDGKYERQYTSYSNKFDLCTETLGRQEVNLENSNSRTAPKDSQYYVEFTVTLPYTQADFDTDKQTKYKKALAMAAGTVPDNVEIVSITEARRRAGSVIAETKVRASEQAGLHALNGALGTGDALKKRVNTALKAMGLAEAIGFDIQEWSVTWVDIVWTVLPLVSDLCVFFVVCTWGIKCRSDQDRYNPGADGKCTICDHTEGEHRHTCSAGGTAPRYSPGADGICTKCDKPKGDHLQYCPEHPPSSAQRRCGPFGFVWVFATACYLPINVGCSIGKLFPPRFPIQKQSGSDSSKYASGEYFDYIGYPGCSSIRCEKVVHNAVMTLVCVPFDLVELYNLHHIADETPISSRPNLCLKIIKKAAGDLGYLLYDTLQQRAPGAGSKGLVAAAFLCGLLTIGFESYTLYRTYRKIQRHDTVTGPNTSEVV
jgi:hypothetical protein